MHKLGLQAVVPSLKRTSSRSSPGRTNLAVWRVLVADSGLAGPQQAWPQKVELVIRPLLQHQRPDITRVCHQREPNPHALVSENTAKIRLYGGFPPSFRGIWRSFDSSFHIRPLSHSRESALDDGPGCCLLSSVLFSKNKFAIG